MNGLSAFPGVGQGFVGGRGDVRSDQRIHSLCCDVSCRLACSSDLSNLSIKYSLLERVDLESCQHIDFLYKKRRSVFFSQLLSNLPKNSSRISILVCFSVELNSFHLFVLLHQVHSLSLEKLLYL